MNLRDEYEKNRSLVDLKQTSDTDLFVLKYKRKVFFSGNWNPFLRVCRGLVVDKDFNIVTLPFDKIHNYGVEKDAPVFDRDEILFASRKVNGFMLAVTFHNGRLIWSTTGSIDSDYVAFAKDMMYGKNTPEECVQFERMIELGSDSTFMFECVHPDDPHIVPEEPGLYFLGARKKQIGSPVVLHSNASESEYWKGTGVQTVETYLGTIDYIKTLVKACKHEGFVISSLDFKTVSKIKSPYYLGKKLLMRTNMKKLLGSNTKNLLDEEFYPIYEAIKQSSEFTEFTEMQRREFIENWFLKQLTI